MSQVEQRIVMLIIRTAHGVLLGKTFVGNLQQTVELCELKPH